MQLPYVPPELIDHLDNIFPLSRYTHCKTEQDLYKHHGMYEVINYLRTLSERQEMNVLTK